MKYHVTLSDKSWMFWALFGDIGWLMYFVCFIGYFFTHPQGFHHLFTQIVTAVSALSGVGILFALAEIISERKQNLTELSEKRVRHGFGLATFSGFLGGASSLLAFLISQEMKGVGRAEMIFLGLCALGGLLCGFGTMKILRSVKPVEND